VATIMVQGVSSDAGKSLIATALCRWLRRRGALVAPFKAQNMSNNARVVDGGEIGTAQWLQALAAGAAADVRMNPVLLKPEADTRSQVVVNGVVSRELTESPWRGRSTRLWPHVEAAYRSLAAEYDVVVIEGAGSPAETNLWADDIVNMRVAELAGAPVLLVADIDRGGAFAHLYGTWALLPPPWRSHIRGFLLNKFRGDAGLLAPAPAELERATGVPTVGVVPWIEHALPDEEGPTVGAPSGRSRRVCIVGGPYASNLDEFVRLQQVRRRPLGAHACCADGRRPRGAARFQARPQRPGVDAIERHGRRRHQRGCVRRTGAGNLRRSADARWRDRGSRRRRGIGGGSRPATGRYLLPHGQDHPLHRGAVRPPPACLVVAGRSVV